MFQSTNEYLEKVTKNKTLLKHNSDNRYLIKFQERDGSISEIYFSVPIRNQQTNDIIQAKFTNTDHYYKYSGSNMQLSINNNKIKFNNDKANPIVTLTDNYINKRNEKLIYLRSTISPTLNGLLFDISERQYTLNIYSVLPFDLRINDRFVAMLGNDGKPFITISCLGAYSANNIFMGVSNIKYDRNDQHNLSVTVYHNNPNTTHFLFEINMFEEKIFEDTTVESKNPTLNNIYGSLAVVGNSGQYGDQWLYSKINMTKLNTNNKKMRSLTLFYPQHDKSDNICSAHKLEKSFCSFGSIWNNKIDLSSVSAQMTAQNGFYYVDVSDMFINKNALPHALAYVIRSKTHGAPLSTGDSYAYPPFMIINYN